jgi:hypothetical protein
MNKKVNQLKQLFKKLLVSEFQTFHQTDNYFEKKKMFIIKLERNISNFLIYKSWHKYKSDIDVSSSNNLPKLVDIMRWVTIFFRLIKADVRFAGFFVDTNLVFDLV